MVEICEKYQCRCYSDFYTDVPSYLYEKVLQLHGTNYIKKIELACQIYSKKCFEAQRVDRFSHLCSFAIENVKEVEEWKRFFDDAGIHVQTFIQSLKMVLNCEHHKINTLRFVGPPSSGKTLLVSTIAKVFNAHFCTLTGCKGDFYYEGMLNKNLIVIEEIFCIPQQADDFKQILCGSALSVNKKFTDKQVLTRTPIMVTSNHNNFGRGFLTTKDENALATRCVTFYMKEIKPPSCKLHVTSLAYFLIQNQ